MTATQTSTTTSTTTRFANRLRAALLLAAVLLTAGCVQTAPVEEAPRSNADTVVLLHGLGRSASAMSQLAERLEVFGFYVISVDYHSLRRSPAEILQDVSRQIDRCCYQERGQTEQHRTKQGQIHFVGHSLGGLLARAYLAENSPPNLGRVVAIGSPAKGTPIVDRYRDRWWFELLGPMANSLGTDPGSFAASLGKPTYPLGVIAGTRQRNNDDFLPGEDDGLVTVESTRVDGMTDFLKVNVGHAGLRYSEDVARQTALFLRTGKFAQPVLTLNQQGRLPPGVTADDD